MATATKPKPKAKSTSKSSSSARKTTARGATKSKPDTANPQTQAVEELREKRAAFDQPVVDTPVDVTDAGGEIEAINGDKLEVNAKGTTVELSFGGKTFEFDSEGCLAFQRKFGAAARGL